MWNLFTDHERGVLHQGETVGASLYTTRDMERHVQNAQWRWSMVVITDGATTLEIKIPVGISMLANIIKVGALPATIVLRICTQPPSMWM
ncbi:hypothetical protein CRG98_015121 [Punica granatum]|uniref:Uncharacterized protein n=1 Tax=Punica granatum TaxID=22663 RepID=A0A2I0K7F4_PUNGR|nr:hypothetical protein CRG98_015121 [Punica granatum]